MVPAATVYRDVHQNQVADMNPSDRIIVIGASAGGVHALLKLTSLLPPKFPAPIAVVLHVGAHPSRLPDVLRSSSTLPVEFARDGGAARRGVIHVAPPDQHLLVDRGRLRLFRGPKEHFARPAINPLFRSAAIAFGPAAVAVVLTGRLDDGAAGARAIKACGGAVVVQDPLDAVEPDMPRSALQATVADHVGTIADIARILGSIAAPMANAPPFTVPSWLAIEHAISLGESSMQELDTVADPSPYTCPECGGTLFRMEDAPARFLCHTGHAFSMRTLIAAQDATTEDAIWSGIRALQEKKLLLETYAGQQRERHPGTETASMDAAAAIARTIQSLRAALDELQRSNGAEQ
jgi:two-component system chemotaxis response regulator CheB